MTCILYSVKWKFRGGCGSNLKVPFMGDINILWNYTIIDVFSILLTASVHMLWFNFILGLNFIFFCFWVW